MTNLNDNLFYAINQFAGQVKLLDGFFIIAANYSPFILAGAMILAWFFARNLVKTRQNIFLALLAFGVAEVVGKIAGVVYYHPQPFATLKGVHQVVRHPIDNAFPSDHTLMFFAVMTVLFLTSKNKGRGIFLAVAFLVGVARIFVGVHYPSDVLAGAVIGIASSYTILFFNQKFNWLQQLNQKISQLGLPKMAQRRH